ncbi:hypothetical protein ACP275_03G062600 [Erythranthe tilingii]
MKGALAWQVTHSIKKYFLCWRGDGTAFWPGSPLRVWFGFFFFFFAFLLSLTTTRGTRLSTQKTRQVHLVGLVTTIMLANSKPTAIAKNHQKRSGVFIHLVF